MKAESSPAVPCDGVEGASGTDDAERIRRATLAHMRHELRTPINAILGYCDLLIEDAEGEAGLPLLRDLRKIRAAGELLLDRVNAVLKGDRGEERETLPALDGIGATLRKELREPLNGVIGYGELLIDVLEERGEGGPLPDLRRIVAAAERLLALQEEIVRAGEVPSEDLDLSGAPEMVRNAVASIRPLDASPHNETGGGRILVAEDNDLNLQLLVRHLERLGHVVLPATDGREALDRLQSERVDLVLLDLMMPGMNGYEALRRIKADQALRELPVLMISALDELDSVVRCIESGADDYLTKPYQPVLLHARVAACLEKKRLRDRELEYLRGVALLTEAAASVEAGEYRLETVPEVAAREDSLGRLARVFGRMAREVDERERRLKRQVERLTIEIDESRKSRQVSEITETDFFREIRQKAREIKEGRS